MVSSMSLWIAILGYLCFALMPTPNKASSGFAAALLADVSLPAKSRPAAPPAEAMRERTYDNFGQEWPRAARPVRNPRHEVIKEDHERGRFVYESPGYAFHADSPISHEASMHFATLFETTKAYLKSLPIGLLKADEETGKSIVLIFGTDQAYWKAGGRRDSAGCYMPGKRLVLVPVSSLEFRKTEKGIERDQQRDYKVLIHELTHQLTPSAYAGHGSLGWFSEGLAEYVGATPYRPGYFVVDRYGNCVKEFVCGHGEDGKGGRALGTTIAIPPLREFMLMGYDRFSGAEANRNYGAALLITYYFFHMEGGGGAKRITEFLIGLRAGKYGEEALTPLHGGEGYQKLQEDISRAWARLGITLSFGGA